MGNPRYPVYIISKGRWDSRLTSRCLDRLRVPYHIIVEPQEADAYRSTIEPSKVLVMPEGNLGQGSIPARNFAWEHSVAEGADWHWLLDDNIGEFLRLNRNLKSAVTSGTVFALAEQFVDRFENVGQAGFQYYGLIPRKIAHLYPPLYLNTRVYSCMLNRNELPFRWRGRYNEDTDLSIRILKAGYCTVLFNLFLAKKRPTMTMKGGNTDELYIEEGRLDMARSLVEQHPDITKIIWRWGRWQHTVNYRAFKGNKLIPKPGVYEALKGTGFNEHGMELQHMVDGTWELGHLPPTEERGA